MYCPKCGAWLEDDAAFCNQCGTRTNAARTQEAPSSAPYLVFAILTTIFCFFPFGIPAIVYATKIDRMKQAGQLQEAKSAATSSMVFSIVAAVAGLLTCGFLLATMQGIVRQIMYL